MQEMKITLEQSPEILTLLQRIAEAIEAAPAQEKTKRTRKKAAEKEPLMNDTCPVPAQPVPESPVSASTVTPQPNPAQTPIQQTSTAPVVQATANAQPQAPSAYQAAPQAPVAPAQQYTHEMLQLACAPLMDMGLGQQLQGLLSHFGVQRVTDIPAEYLGAFATELRRLGAKI